MDHIVDREVFAECALLGAAVIAAQRVEFLLYGLVSHFSASSDSRDRRLRGLDPDKFLRGDVEDLKATLGLLVREFRDKLLITTDELLDFVNNRNLIAHNYWRLTLANLPDGPHLADPQRFLATFIGECSHWEGVLRGILALAQKEAARRWGEEVMLDANELAWVAEYERNVERYLERWVGSNDP